MDTKELISLLEDFLNENGSYNDFVVYANEKGYTEKEIENNFEKAKQ